MDSTLSSGWIRDTLHAANKQLFSPERMASLVDDIEGDEWERRVICRISSVASSNRTANWAFTSRTISVISFGPLVKIYFVPSLSRALVLAWLSFVVCF